MSVARVGSRPGESSSSDTPAARPPNVTRIGQSTSAPTPKPQRSRSRRHLRAVPSAWTLDTAPLDDHDENRESVTRSADAPSTEPPPLPESLTGRGLDHVPVVFDAPAAPYVTADPWDVHAGTRASCMKVGPAIAYPDGSVRHVVVPCFSTTCEVCGPERHRRILDDMRSNWAGLESVMVHTIRATRDSDLRRQRRTVTQAIQARGGEYLSVVVAIGDDLACIVFSDVDHSARGYRGRVARTVDVLAASDALAYLHVVLWHGLRWPRGRNHSEGWPLSDGERSRSGASTGDAVGQMGARTFDRMLTIARDLYEAHRQDAATRSVHLPPWSADDDRMPRIRRADRIDILTNARRRALNRSGA